MKGKRYTKETKIRILREAQSRDKTIQDGKKAGFSAGVKTYASQGG
jgi:hypothetical protein